MVKTEVDRLMEKKTVEALKYIDKMGYEPDTNGYAETMDEVRKNYDLLIKRYEAEEKAEREVKEAKAKRTDRLIQIGTGLVEIAVPAVLYFCMGKACLVYEETGTITSAIGKSLVNKIRPDM